MKFVTYTNSSNQERLGIYVNGKVADLQKTGQTIGIELPDNIIDFIKGGDTNLRNAKSVEKHLLTISNLSSDMKLPLAPVPHPPSCRDAYAFRQHVAAARKNRGVEMIPEFDQFPIFYFTNHNAIFGEGDIIVERDHCHKLDFELEVAVVIGKQGTNISSKDADDYIFGYTIMNDFSARRLQMEEMLLSLGPAKGKDFATSIGPWLVTKDELENRMIETEFGKKYDLRMVARHNGKQVSEGNMKDMNWTFAEIIERCSYGTSIFPGDVIGSGTVGTGCYLELNGTWNREAKEKGISFEPIWLQPGDTIELEIDMLGILTNKIVLSGNNVSILEKKKNI